MRVMVVVVGRPRDTALRSVIEHYETRASRYWPLEITEVREEPARATSPDLVREREGERLGSRLPASGTIVACEEGGAGLRSEEFAAWLQSERERARDVAFVIGGAFGLADGIHARAARSLALAPWTLPHELARLVLAEQLYRAGTIVRGEPYHK